MTQRHILLAIAAALPFGTCAQAADIDMLLAAPELTLTESRSGPYLRADLFYDFASDLDTTRTLTTPFGAGSLPLGATDLSDSAAVALGVGYQFTDMLRADLTARYAEPERGTGGFFVPGCGSLCFARDGAELREWEVLLNGYVDLGTVAGFTPYLGGGLGAVHQSYDDPILAVCGAGTCATSTGSGSDEWRFSYAASAGVAYDLTQDVSLDVGYRYLNVEGGENYGFQLNPSAALRTSDDGFDRHSIHVGLRYKLW